MWGPLGTFSPGCLENPTTGTYASGGSLSSSVAPYRQTWSWGPLRCLRAIPLEALLLSTEIASPSPFTWVSPGIFSGCLRTVLTAITRASASTLVFLCLSFFPHTPCHNRLTEPVATDYLKTDLVHTRVLVDIWSWLGSISVNLQRASLSLSRNLPEASFSSCSLFAKLASFKVLAWACLSPSRTHLTKWLLSHYPLAMF